MNKLKFSLIITFILIIISSSAFSETKQNAEAVLLDDNVQMQTFAQPGFGGRYLCKVNHAGPPHSIIHNWLIGDEQYMAYQNPVLTCAGPYPFTVKEVSMILYFDRETILTVSVAINTADTFDPSCPVPGDIISSSGEYMFQIKPPGLWRIVIPPDEPAIVNEPYFASFNILTQLHDPNSSDSQDSVMLVIDSIPGVCQNYNLWDPNNWSC